jgi:hypothetical protein
VAAGLSARDGVTLNGVSLDFVSNDLELTAGDNTFVIDFSGARIAAAGRDGPYVVRAVQVRPVGNPGLVALVDGTPTAAYKAAAFGSPAVPTSSVQP